MSKTLSRPICTSDSAMWKMAIKDAKNKLKKARESVIEWESVIETFNARIKDGTPWPTPSVDQSEGATQ